MRYYVYVSRAKIDMMFEQIPRKLLPRLVTEARADLKIVSVAVQQPRDEPTLYDRLNAVEDHLDREYDIGWMTEPAFWFRGESALRIAAAGDASSPVLMTGREGDLVVALIGSAHHLVGREAPASELGRVGHSWLPSLYGLLEEARTDTEFVDVDAEGRDDRGTLRDVLTFSGRATGPATWCEFLARQLMRGTVTGPDGRPRQVVIATPLYVAMSDELQGA
ncbi:DUF7019 family protein [Streptomyces sp. NPDC051183]|uniref:DUF7019 family protein n=1 Tax=unclassified Streptomyces TaxID=2593676 RepID=UPI0034272B7B